MKTQDIVKRKGEPLKENVMKRNEFGEILEESEVEL